MKLRTTHTLLALIMLTGTMRVEADTFSSVNVTGDATVAGSLTLDGDFDLSGTTFNLGTNGANPGFAWEFSLEVPPGGTQQATILRSQASSAPGGACWSWETLDPNGAWKSAMELAVDGAGNAALKLNGNRILTVVDLGGLAPTGGFQTVSYGGSQNSVVFGAGVSSVTGGQVVVGKYNDASPAGEPSLDKTKGVFIVGAGSGVSGGQNNVPEKQNALRVLEDGTVLVLARGDLGMGDFTNGPQP